MSRGKENSRSFPSDTLSDLPSALLSSDVNVGASTSRSSSTSIGVGGRREATLGVNVGASTSRSCSSSMTGVAQSVPASALSGAQWATRSDSSSHDVSGSLWPYRRETLNQSCTSTTPLLHKSLPSDYLTKSSPNVQGTNYSALSARTTFNTPYTPASRKRGLSSRSSSSQYPLRTPTHFHGDSTILLPTSASGDEHSVDLPSGTRRKWGEESTSIRQGVASSSSTSVTPTQHTPSAAAAHYDLTQDDLGLPDLSEDDISQVVMSVSWSQGKLGAAFYDITSAQVYVVEDKVDAAPDFWVLTTLFREQRPRWVLVGGRQDDRLFTMLRQLCGMPPTPLCRESTSTPTQNEGGGSSSSGGGRGSVGGASNTGAPSPAPSSTTGSCTIRVLPMADFKYELCVRRVLSLVLPGEPEGITEEERELFVRGKVNTDLVSMTRALGALLRFLDKHGLELLASTVLMDGTPILGLHVYAMEELAQLDDATATALQLFSEDQHPAAFKSGKSSASKEGLSVYALLSRTSCPMAAHTLRRVLLRPMVDQEVLEARYSAVGWGVDPANLDTLRQLQACLRHITNVPYTMTRLQRGQLNVRDWKILYKSLFNSILVGELCQAHDKEIPIFRQTGESVTEGLYRATFLIQRIMDMEQSEREARFVVKPGVDTELDDKKRRFNGLGEVMRRIAELELTHLPEEVESCCIIYLPHVGYLLAFSPTPAFNDTLSAHDYTLPGLEFMFKTADMVLYKSQTCLELDRELGDIQVEIANHETRIMMRLVETVVQQAQHFLALLQHILMLDCLLAFSVVSRECGWVRPELREEPMLEIQEARHPLYELCTPTFVANPIRSGRPSHQCITLVTGPNASGKTVYLKQVGVIAVLAQVGCWVPARRACLRPLDAIIAVTQTTPPVTSALSTFMLDLTRMCAALARATQYSLVIIDEFGAATYENDGAALLTACLDYWSELAAPRRPAGSCRRRKRGREDGNSNSSHRREEDEEINSSSNSGIGQGRVDEGAPPHVFVSTHLLQVYDHLLNPEAVRCLVLEAVEEDGAVVPLYQVAEGRAHTSYAAAVAAISGVPQNLIQRANQVYECIRGGRLPPRWSLLEDENERRRCEAVVSLLLSHDLSKDPLHILLEKVRGYSQKPGSPGRSHHMTMESSDSARFRTPSGTPRRSRSRREKTDGEASDARSALESGTMLQRDVANPLINCVESVLSSRASGPVRESQGASQGKPQSSPKVLAEITPQGSSQNTPQATPHTASWDTPRIMHAVTPRLMNQGTPRATSRKTPVVKPQITPQAMNLTVPQVAQQTMGQATPQTRAQVTPQTIGQVTPQTRAQDTPQTMGQATPQTMGQVTPQTRAQVMPQTMGQVTPWTRAQVTRRTMGQVTPQIKSQVTPQTIGHITSQTRDQISLQNKGQLTPQTREQLTPQTTEHLTPQNREQLTPQTREQLTPQSRAQVTPQTKTQASNETSLHTVAQLTPQTRVQSTPQTRAYIAQQTWTQANSGTRAFVTPQIMAQLNLSESSQPTGEATPQEGAQGQVMSRRSVARLPQGIQMTTENRACPSFVPESQGQVFVSITVPTTFHTPLFGDSQDNSLKHAPSLDAQIRISQIPKEKPHNPSDEFNNSYVRLPSSEPCTPGTEPSLKMEPVTPMSSFPTTDGPHNTRQMESVTPLTVPFDSINEPCSAKSEIVTPLTLTNTPNTSDIPGIQPTLMISHATGISQTPKIPSASSTTLNKMGIYSKGSMKHHITPESTLASISLETEESLLDSPEQYSSNVSSCSQESIPLTRQYFKPPSFSQFGQDHLQSSRFSLFGQKGTQVRMPEQ